MNAPGSSIVVLVESPAQIEPLRGGLARLGEGPEACRWVCLDVTASLALDAAGIAYRADEAYLLPGAARDLERIAHEAATTWHGQIPADAGWGRAGDLVFKDLAYFLLGLLRTERTLAAILEAERPSHVVAFRSQSIPVAATRLQAGESHVPALLESFHVRSGNPFEIAWVEGGDETLVPALPPAREWIREFVPRWLRTRGVRTVLYAGSRSLLGPVIARLRERGWRPVECLERPSLRRWWAALWSGDGILSPSEMSPSEMEVLEPGPAPDAQVVRGALALPMNGDGGWNRVRSRAEFLARRSGDLAELAWGIEEALDHSLPRALLVDEDVTEFKRLLVSLCEKRGVPAFLVQHGVPLKPLGFVPPRAGRIAVWGPFFRDLLAGWGVLPERMRVTGCPRYDGYAEAPADPERRKRFCASLGLSPEAPLVAFAPGQFPRCNLERFDSTLSNPWEFKRFVRSAIDTARRFPKVSIVLKLHAGGFRPDFFRFLELQTRTLANLRIESECDVRGLLEASSLVVSSYSSLVLEAILLGRPVAVANLSGYPNDDPYVATGGVLPVKDAGEIEGLVASMERGEGVPDLPEGRRTLLDSLLGGQDRRAAERVAAWIEEVAS